MFGKKNVTAVIAEFVGTAVLTMLVLTVQRSTIGVPFFIAAAAGLVVIIMMIALIDVSGANFNPALTLALWTARKASTARAIFYIGAQLLGGWAAYYLYTYLVNTKLTPIGGHYAPRILVAEAFGAAIFAFVWAASMYQKQSSTVRSTIAGIGFMIGMIAASSAAIGLINPAVALGVRAWVWGTYVLGPVLGAVVGVNLYALLFASDDKNNSLKASIASVTASITGTKKTDSSKSSSSKSSSRRTSAKK